MKAPEQQAILARDSAGSLDAMEGVAAAQQAQMAALGSTLADKEAQLASLSDALSAAEQALLSAQQQGSKLQAASAAPTAQHDAALGARWACLSAQRQELAARWQCLAEDRKQLSFLMQQAGRRGGGEWASGGAESCSVDENNAQRAARLQQVFDTHLPRCRFRAPLCRATARAPHCCCLLPSRGQAPLLHCYSCCAGGDSGFEPGQFPVRDVRCAIISHQVDIPCGSCCFQR